LPMRAPGDAARLRRSSAPGSRGVCGTRHVARLGSALSRPAPAARSTLW
jgi:hypothetical protein